MYIYIYGVEGVWVHLLGGHGVPDRVILDVRESIWNAIVFSLDLTPFDDISSLSSSLVTVSLFLVKNKETEMKPTTFYMLHYVTFHAHFTSHSTPTE